MCCVLDGLRGKIRTGLWVGRDDGSLPPAERALLGPWNRVKGLDRGGLRQRGGLAAQRRLEKALAQCGRALLHLHNIMDPCLLRTAAAARPALLTVQDHRFFCPGRGKLKPDGRICRQVLGEACLDCFAEADYGRRLLSLTRARLRAAAGVSRVLVLSRYMAGELLAAWQAEGLPAPPVEVLPPFVHGFEPLPRKAAGGYHLLASRLVGRKGVRVALKAARLVNLPLWVAGDGPLRGEVEEAALQSRGRVRYLGWAQRAGLARLLAGARSLWLPSLWAEPFGIIGLEALAAGAPVVASRVGGVGDWLIDGENGFFAQPGLSEGLAQAALALEERPALAGRMGRAGAAMVARRFSPRKLMERLIIIYKEIWAGYNSGHE